MSVNEKQWRKTRTKLLDQRNEALAEIELLRTQLKMADARLAAVRPEQEELAEWRGGCEAAFGIMTATPRRTLLDVNSNQLQEVALLTSSLEASQLELAELQGTAEKLRQEGARLQKLADDHDVKKLRRRLQEATAERDELRMRDRQQKTLLDQAARALVHANKDMALLGKEPVAQVHVEERRVLTPDEAAVRP